MRKPFCRRGAAGAVQGLCRICAVVAACALGAGAAPTGSAGAEEVPSLQGTPGAPGSGIDGGGMDGGGSAAPAQAAAAAAPVPGTPAAETPAAAPAAAAGERPAGGAAKAGVSQGAATDAAAPAAAPAVAPAGDGGAATAFGAADPEQLVREFRRTGRALAVERGAEVLWPYGHGRPVLRCAPLRACAIALESGESVLTTSLGDSERWLVQSVLAGPSPRQPLVVVKPASCDVASNLLIATDRRLYEVALDSPPCKGGDGGEGSYNPRLPYTGLLRFYYPEVVQRWESEAVQARAEAHRQAAAQTALAPTASLAQLNFAYTWDRGRRVPWNPAQIFDDGVRTYVVLPPASRQADLPLLFAADAAGKLVLVNYRVQGQTLIAERVIERAALVVGAPGSKGAQRLDIVNRAYPGGGR